MVLFLVKLYAPVVHRLKKNGVLVYPKMKTVHTYLVNLRDMVYPKGISQNIQHTFIGFFWDMEYSRDIPKKIRYIRFFSFYGIWDIQGISPKITVHSLRGYILMFEF